MKCSIYVFKKSFPVYKLLYVLSLCCKIPTNLLKTEEYFHLHALQTSNGAY